MLETERFIIRRLTLDDAEHVLALVNSPGFIKNIGDRGIRDLAQATIYLQQGTLASYQQHGYGMFAVEDKHNGDWLGQVGLIKREHLPYADLGYALLPQFVGKGVATEAAKAVVDWAKAQGMQQLLGVITPSNRQSANVLTKLGFQPEGLIDWPDDDQVMLYRAHL
ncbi:GNAT family N-acetyltransferase [Shewanella waksmanii]|uniref:GNAT family N-acetyltransferase n=1 Tax=Shewanella waksmanii TaxID=213783 RepID=UPI00373671D4